MKLDKEMFINVSAGSTRIALTENGNLSELHIERPDYDRLVGNIYKGKVQNVIPGMQAAFVDIGQEANAFLPQQVRRIVGAVLEVGFRRRSPESFRALADSHVQGSAEWVIPAQGLCLRKVKYREMEFTDHVRN